MIVRALTTHLLDRHLAARLTRLIPHPGVRAVATVAATFVVPFIVERLLVTTVGAVTNRVRPALKSRSA